MRNPFAVIVASAVVSACATDGNIQDPGAEPTENETPAFQEPIDYIPSALGPYSWKISTSSELAQRYFDQGLQSMPTG